MKVPLNEHGQRKVAKGYCRIIGPMRESARALGYALAVHGSIKRDIDIVAIPWTEEAVDAQQLADAMRDVVRVVIGFGEYGCDGPFPRPKPHGRRCWTIHFWGTYVDLSVMPRLFE